MQQAVAYAYSLGLAALSIVERWISRQSHSFEKLEAKAPAFWWVVPFVGFVGAVVALFAIRANHAIARRKATLDLIERSESSDYYTGIRKSFKSLELTSSDQFLETLLNSQDAKQIDFRASIYAYMNHYELVAVGCKNGILDATFYSMWMRTQLVRDWTSAKPLILLLRTNPTRPQPTAYMAFEALARRFEREKERETRVSSFKGLGRALRRRSR